ncbi:MAG TPA: hypothetical protein VLQ76_04240 [Bacteroidales bacterium]|nr:hypothetical protein [Bacteroidales bacterium]
MSVRITEMRGLSACILSMSATGFGKIRMLAATEISSVAVIISFDAIQFAGKELSRLISVSFRKNPLPSATGQGAASR